MSRKRLKPAITSHTIITTYNGAIKHLRSLNITLAEQFSRSYEELRRAEFVSLNCVAGKASTANTNKRDTEKRYHPVSALVMFTASP